MRAAPEGLIDPMLKTLSFWNERRPLAALHYYATHPMSYYGDGRVTSDFCGLARHVRATEDDRTFQAYFTGCAGNITAGKYNDGARANRAVLRDRILSGMRAAWRATERHPVKGWEWRVEPITLAPRREPSFAAEVNRRRFYPRLRVRGDWTRRRTASLARRFLPTPPRERRRDVLERVGAADLVFTHASA